MRRYIKYLCIVGIIVADSDIFAISNEGFISNNTLIPRSFNSYQYHDLVQLKYSFPLLHDRSKKNQTSLSFFTDYMATMRKSSCDLGSLPFWSGSNTMTIGNNDGRAHLDAYQFGLGQVVTDAQGIAGTVKLAPKIEQVGGDLLLSYAHIRNNHRMFFKIHVPLGAMIVTPNLTEPRVARSDNMLSMKQTTMGVPGNPSEKIDFQFDDYPTLNQHQRTISESFIGGVYQENVPMLRGNIFQLVRLRKGRISPKKQTIIRLGDITASCGYNVVDKDVGYVGVAFKFSCPTGNVPTADYMLEPIFGRAGSWGVGGEITGAYRIWEDVAQERDVKLLVQSEFLHLAPGRNFNFRSFDLKQNGPGSKYLLVQNYIATVDPNPFVATNEVMSPQRIEPLINYTTLPVFSRIAFEGSIAAMLDYNHGNKNIGVGCEFWGRTREKLKIDMVTAVDLRYQNLNNFAVLGRQLATYKIDGQGFLPTYLCEPKARINKSQDPVVLIGSVPNVTLDGVVLPDGIADARLSKNRIPENLDDALDIAGAQSPALYSGKLFCTLGYSWNSGRKISKPVRSKSVMSELEKADDFIYKPKKQTTLEMIKQYLQKFYQFKNKNPDLDRSILIDDTAKSSLAPRYIPTIAIITGIEFINSRHEAIKLWNLGLHLSVNF